MDSNRREVKSRNNNLFHKLSRFLIKLGLKPNHISIASVVFGSFGFYGFYLLAQGLMIGVLIVFLGIQLRLVCNLIDGLMAVEGNLSSTQGELYNDVPDRFSDWALLLGAGLVIQNLPYGWHLAWGTVVLAILTAYVRLLGASQGVGHDFGGPMAKQHRMALLNFGLVGVLIEHYAFSSDKMYSLYGVMLLICIGSGITVFLRLRRIAGKLA